jgi:hypothetical protein
MCIVVHKMCILLWFFNDCTPFSLLITAAPSCIWMIRLSLSPFRTTLNCSNKHSGSPQHLNFQIKESPECTIFNATKCMCNLKYFLFCDAPSTCFSPCRPSSQRSCTKEYIYNKCCPRRAYVKLKYSVVN